MKIRPIKQKEIKFASKIVGKNYSKEYEKIASKEIGEMFRNVITRPNYIVAEEKGEVLGFGGYIQSWMDYNVYHIFWVNVRPDKQRKGIGTAIVKKLIEIINNKKAFMILLTTSKPKFYAKKFKFKTLVKFKNNKYNLMGLILRKSDNVID